MHARMKAWLRENRRLLAFVLLLGVFRTAVADWNPIPSASMHPALLEGDVVFVNRLAFDVKLPLTNVILAHTGEPRRGDVVTFFSPENGERLIKRVIGLPGETIEMHGKRLFVDGAEASYQPLGQAGVPVIGDHGRRALYVEEETADGRHEIQWLAKQAPADDFGPVTIPAGHYLMLGDNRDNSYDSRYFGLVPRERLIGRAECVLVSLDYKGSWALRTDRFGKSLR